MKVILTESVEIDGKKVPGGEVVDLPKSEVDRLRAQGRVAEVRLPKG